ncbi:MAG: hypothetical protein IKV41_01475 [Oscillospiraceae bacterium]|nr:hypothetical protein [Oscillospiraceae bacterium]
MSIFDDKKAIQKKKSSEFDIFSDLSHISGNSGYYQAINRKLYNTNTTKAPQTTVAPQVSVKNTMDRIKQANTLPMSYNSNNSTKGLFETMADGVAAANTNGWSTRTQRNVPTVLPSKQQLGYYGSMGKAGFVGAFENISDAAMTNIGTVKNINAGLAAANNGTALAHMLKANQSIDNEKTIAEALSTHKAQDIVAEANKKYNPTQAEQAVGEVVMNTTAMLPVVGASMINPALGRGVLAAQAYGGAVQNAVDDGADLASAKKYGAASAALEVGSEMLGGIPGMGGGLLGVLNKRFGTQMTEKLLKVVGSKGISVLLNAFEEGGEEALVAILDPYAKRLTYNPNAQAASFEDTAKAFALGAVTSGVLQGGVGLAGRAVNFMKVSPSNTVVRKMDEYSAEETARISSSKNVFLDKSNSIKTFVAEALANKSTGFKRMYLGKIPLSLAQEIKATTGLSVDGYNLVLSNDKIRKILKDHGRAETEIPRGQIPIDADLMERIPEIVANPDKIYLSGTTDQGKPVIKFEKWIDGYAVVVENVSDKHKNLETQTFYIINKKKPVTGLDTKMSQANTPEAHSDTVSNSIISNPPQNINTPQNFVPRPMPQRSVQNGAANNVQAVADKLGVAVEFTDSLGDGVNGEYRDGKIYISTTAKQPVMEIFRHELTHHIESSGAYAELQGMVLERMSDELLENGVTLEQYRTYLMESYAAKGVVLDENGANAEMVANFVETRLFTSDEEIQRLANTNNSLAQRIYRWLSDTIAKLKGTAEERFLIEVRRKYENALRTADGGVGRVGQYSVETLPNGNKYVKADRQVIKSTDHTKWEGELIAYINQKVRNGKKILIPTDDGDVLTVDGKTAWKMGYRNDIVLPDGTRGKLTDAAYLTKLRAAGHIDELARISTRGNKVVPDYNGKHGNFASGGWNYRTAYFQDFDGSYYQLKISTAINPNGIVVYNIADIQKRRFPSVNGSSPNGALNKGGRKSSNTNVAQSQQGVNNQSMQNKPQYALDISNEELLRGAIEKYGALPKGEQPRAREVDIPKRTEHGKTARFARTAAESAVVSDEATDGIKEAVANGTFAYSTITDKGAVTNANVRIAEKGYDQALAEWRAIVQSNKRMNKYDVAFAERLIQEASKKGDVHTVTELVADVAAIGVEAGQTIQAFRILKRLGPEGQLLYVQRSIDRMNATRTKKKLNDAELTKVIKLEEEKHKQKALGNQAIIDSINRELAKIKGEYYLSAASVQDILSQTTPEGVKAASERALIDVAGQLPADWVTKFNQWRYLAMLGNARTHIRNVLGNCAFYVERQIKDVVATAGEAVLLPTTKRSKAFLNPFSEQDKALINYAKADWKNVREQAMNGGKYTPMDIIREHQKVFDTAPIEWARKKNSALLEAEDEFFLRAAYVDALAMEMKARGVTPNSFNGDMAEGIRNRAVVEAQKATFRDASVVANELNRLENLNAATRIFMGGLMPFKKTPINILKRGIEYSPIGLIKGISADAIKVRNNEITANEFIDNISAGLTGTALLAVGAYLAKYGILSGGADEDDKQAAMDKLVGEQQYAVNFGDYSYTIDWAAPAALPLFVGVEVYNSMGETMEFKTLVDSLCRISLPLFEMSMMQGINDALKSVRFGNVPVVDAALDTVSGYMSQSIPTLFGQAARTVDDTSRNAYYVDKNSVLPQGLQITINQAQAKIPGLSYNLPARVDRWGRIENSTSAGQRAFQNFISPGYIDKDNITTVDTEIQRLYKETGENVVPPAPEKKITFDGETKYLSGKEYEQFAITQGKTSFNIASGIIALPIYNKLSDEQKTKAIQDAYSFARYTARKELMPEYEKDGWEAKAEQATAAGIAPETYIAYRTVNDLDGNGNVTQKEAEQAILMLPIYDRKQQEALWRLTNEKWKEENNPFR